MKRLSALLLALVLCVSLLPGYAAGEPAFESASETAAADGMTVQTVTGTADYAAAFEVLRLVNEVRAENDLAPMVMDAGLMETAMQRAAEISILFEHERPNGEDCFEAFPNYNWYTMAENIAMGQSNAESVMNSWMNSSGHRKNILSSNNIIGIGCVVVNGVNCWVQCFMGVYNPPASDCAQPANAVRSFSVEVPDSTTTEPTDPPTPPEGSVEISTENFPDANFRAIIAEYYDPDKDGWLSPEEIADTQVLECYSADIKSLKGIELFTELEYLDCEENDLSNLDLNNFPNLQVLYCSYNDLADLDLSKCPNLQVLYCSNNGLTEIDLSDVPELVVLDCSDDNLTDLDLSGSTELQMLSCGGNAIAELDLSKCPELAWLYCENNPLTRLDIRPCPELVASVMEGRIDEESEQFLAYLRYDEEADKDYWSLTIDYSVELVFGDSPAMVWQALDAARILQWVVGLADKPEIENIESVELPDAAVILSALN